MESENAEKIELNERDIKQLKKQPIIETRMGLSKDGKWLIHKTTVTDIKSVDYYGKILEGQ